MTSTTSGKILLVEDDSYVLQLLEDDLMTHGAETTAFSDSLEAAQVIEKVKFDGIITDIKMSGISGIELIEKIQQSSLNGQTPVFVITGYNEPEIMGKIKKLNVCQTFLKPLFFDDMFDKISELV